MSDVSDLSSVADAMPWQDRVERACAQACEAIAPTWPLDRAIAVNPHWQRIGMPVLEVAARMAVLADIRVFPPRALLAQAWRDGRITAQDLTQALADLPAAAARLDVAACVQALSEPGHTPRLPLLIDVLDDDAQRHRRLSWRQAITHQVSQTCAAYFDQDQADWQPERSHGLYAFWRDTLVHDQGIGVLMGLPTLGRAVGQLPATREDAESWALRQLGLPEDVWADYLEAVLLSVNGWASWCAYLGWQARLAGGRDPHLRDLLAIRLAWGAILLATKDDASTRHAFAALQSRWREAPAVLDDARARLRVDEVWQLALDVSWQRRLAQQLQQPAVAGHQAAPMVQAAFCIDVRSEPMRRALEAECPEVQTLGVAGFFGLPVAYTSLGSAERRPQLPGLLAPAIDVHDAIDAAPDQARPSPDQTERARQARQRHWAITSPWQAASHWPGAAYSFVEAAGVAYLGPLLRWLHPTRGERARDDLSGLPVRYRPVCRPALAGLSLAEQVDLAGGVLQGMGMPPSASPLPLAPLVVLVGHGSQSHNNAHAAALDCGACCGQTGEVNARVLARLLNDPAVRDGLAQRGSRIPPATRFVAALHNTTTDDIEAFDADLLPAHALAAWQALMPRWQRASDRVRQERAPSLGLAQGQPLTARQLHKQLQRRANDGAQTRPEWGLAGNAAFVIAPRWRTQHANLAGRSFLHDYDPARDPDGSWLTQLMTAPMLVTHWINWQYHASTCDPDRLGSGNKVLHNVVGGHLGVFEGNGGDLRIGLSRQSLHDGQRWVHDPVRLTVVIDAPADRIDAIVAAHEPVRHLVAQGWLHLWRFEGAQLQRRTQTGWAEVMRG